MSRELDTTIDSRFGWAFFLECADYESRARLVDAWEVTGESFAVTDGESLMAATKRGARLQICLDRPPKESGLLRRQDGDVYLNCLTAYIRSSSKPVYELHINNPCLAELYADTEDLFKDPTHVYIYIETLSDIQTLEAPPGFLRRLFRRHGVQ